MPDEKLAQPYDMRRKFRWVLVAVDGKPFDSSCVKTMRSLPSEDALGKQGMIELTYFRAIGCPDVESFFTRDSTRELELRFLDEPGNVVARRKLSLRLFTSRPLDLDYLSSEPDSGLLILKGVVDPELPPEQEA